MASGTPVVVLLTTLLLSGCGTDQGPTSRASNHRSSATPTTSTATTSAGSSGSIGAIGSMVVVGHSGATGWNSDRSTPGIDAKANSWASGTNPDVRSIYLRLAATSPRLVNHAVNAAVSGSRAADLDGQLDTAFRSEASPDLVLIQTVDNDIRCDGTDDANYRPFREAFAAALHKIAAQSPHAVILVVSSPWATVENYAAVVAALPGGAEQFAGTGPCDMFDADGKARQGPVRYLQQLVDRYQAQVVAACRQVPTCHDDGGALAHMTVVAADLTPDFNHLSIVGQAKQAALEWEVLTPFLPHP